jgi:8-oxo-dGTP pyrophosphatase MutT (NUDIX family)
VVFADPIASLRRAIAAAGGASSDFDLNPDVVLPENRVLRPAAVLVGVTMASGAPEVILTKRSSHLKHHPGQIAFPGGKQDETDTNLAQTALREAREEIGLPSDIVEVLGEMPVHETVTGFRVTPIVAHIQKPFTAIPEAGEVDEVFQVPLSHFVGSQNFQIQGRRWRGMKRHYYTAPYGPYYIWGATARMLRALSEGLEP